MDSMEHCTQCNSTLAKEEKVCWACNAEVPEQNPKTSLHTRFHSLINLLFIVFALLAVAALFLPTGYVPSFYKCVAGLVVMYLVRSSIQNMTDAKKN
jgi:predicted nucleic acid-binding Zn ribbon protein